jgi:hypothetical protein
MRKHEVVLRTSRSPGPSRHGSKEQRNETISDQQSMAEPVGPSARPTIAQGSLAATGVLQQHTAQEGGPHHNESSSFRGSRGD